MATSLSAHRSVTDLQNWAFDPDLSAFRVDLGTETLAVSALSIGLIGDCLAVSAGTVDAWAICAYGGGSLPVSTSTCWPVSSCVVDAFAVCAHGDGSLPVCASIANTIGVSAGTAQADALHISGDIGLHTYDTLSSNATSSVAANTSYQLPSWSCKSVAVKADDDNANNIWIGSQASPGYRLAAGQGISFRVDNVNTIWFSADAAAQEIQWIAITE